MLSVPTLLIIYAGNFLAIGVVWTYVLLAYPHFRPARYWTAAAFIAATGVGFAVLRGVVEPWIPIVIGNGLMLTATFMAAMGVRQYFNRPLNWPFAIVTIVATLCGLSVFTFWRDDLPVRILIYSLGQSVPILMMLRTILSQRQQGFGARTISGFLIAVLAIHALRSIAGLLGVGGDPSLVDLNAFQAVMIVFLMFLATACNFGGLLMAFNQIRGEAAYLALLDDLTGVANRRFLAQRLNEECARSTRSGEAFVLLAIDLDGFKAINDSYGHGAGDQCLRSFTLLAQGRLRPGDLLARVGGDEFCIVLPSTTLREGGMIARRILDVCRDQAIAYGTERIALAASIGVAQWRPEMEMSPDPLIIAADEALYVAKNSGKNCYALGGQPAAEPVPEPPLPLPLPVPLPVALRKSA